MFEWLRGKDLRSVVSAEKKKVINGINFTLKKIDPLDHAKGLKVMQSCFQVYTTAGPPTELSDGQMKKVREHYRDVFLASVVKPKLSIKEEEEGRICVNEIFKDTELAENLYTEIMIHTYGKKKMKSLI